MRRIALALLLFAACGRRGRGAGDASGGDAAGEASACETSADAARGAHDEGSSALDASAADARAADGASAAGRGSAGASPMPVDGPHEIPFAPGRPVYYALPSGAPGPSRLIGHIHGVCGPPFYACGKWLGAAVDTGVLVCPTGNARCGDPVTGLASWEAPSWGELVTVMDRDLEQSIARVEAKHPGSIRREGAILTGYSRGGFAVPIICAMHPGRWPLLLIIEADATLAAPSLRRAGVRAVALVAGEWGTERAGMTKTADALSRAGLPARAFVMPKTGHLYPEKMDDVMRGALAFLVEHDAK